MGLKEYALTVPPDRGVTAKDLALLRREIRAIAGDLNAYGFTTTILQSDEYLEVGIRVQDPFAPFMGCEYALGFYINGSRRRESDRSLFRASEGSEISIKTSSATIRSLLCFLQCACAEQSLAYRAYGCHSKARALHDLSIGFVMMWSGIALRREARAA